MTNQLPWRCLTFASVIVLILQAVLGWAQDSPLNAQEQLPANDGEKFYVGASQADSQSALLRVPCK